jgi:hypothetical protein
MTGLCAIYLIETDLLDRIVLPAVCFICYLRPRVLCLSHHSHLAGWVIFKKLVWREEEWSDIHKVLLSTPAYSSVTISIEHAVKIEMGSGIYFIHYNHDRISAISLID